MPTDPKFGTVARVSGEQISLVLSVYLHLMVDASRNVTRGHVTVTAEDIATALNVTDLQIEKILAAMNGRLIVDGVLSGWDKRQVKREDSGDEETGAKSAAQRKKEQRDREKQAEDLASQEDHLQQCHEASRNVTLDKKRVDKEEEVSKDTLSTEVPSPIPNCPHSEIIDLFAKHLPTLPRPSAELWDGARAEALRSRWRWVLTAKKKSGARYATTKAEAIEWFDRFFAYTAESDFLSGRNGKWTACDLGWLVKSENFAKVVQGNYDNKAAA